MGWKGIKHRDPSGQEGEEIDSTEWQGEELHELANGVTLPETGNNDGDLFYKTDEHRLYIWKQE